MAEVKANALGGLIGAAVAQPDPLHHDRTDASLHLAFRTMAVANHAVTPVRQAAGPSWRPGTR